MTAATAVNGRPVGRGPAGYAPLRPRTLSVQLVVLVLAEIGLFRVYGNYDSRFHWAAHFLVGLIAAAGWLSAVLLVRAAPARGQLLTVLALHVYAMAPDLVFRAGVPHDPWMNVFLGHVWVHYLPGGDRSWLVLALAAVAGYCLLLSRWLQARTDEAAAGMAPGIGIRGAALLHPQDDPAVTELAHEHAGPRDQPVVLVLHGLGGTGASLAGLAAALGRRGIRTLTPDLLGHGGSRGIGTRFGLPAQVAALELLLARHGLEHVDLLAHSYGCAVAAAFANRHPSTVGHAMLVCPPAFPDADTARRVLGARSWSLRRVDHGCPGYRAALTSLFGDTLPCFLAGPPVRTTVLLAEDDRTAPPEQSQPLLGDRVTVRRIAGDHLVPVTDPDRVADVVATGRT